MNNIFIFIMIFLLGLGMTVQSCSKRESDIGKEIKPVKTGNSLSSEKTVREYPKAPDFALQNNKGEIVKLSDYAGKVVVLDFWATWCGPCRMEIPGFIKLYDKYNEQGVEVIGVSLDQQGWNVVKPFMDQYKIDYPVVLGNREVVNAYGGITGIPTTFLINRKGEIVERLVGYRPLEYFENAVTELLNKKQEG